MKSSPFFKTSLILLVSCLSLNLSAATDGTNSKDRNELSLAVSYSSYDFEQNVMKIIFANLDESKIQYKIFSENDRLKSLGRFDSEAGMNFVDVDISYYQSGNYVLEMNDGNTEVIYYFNVNRPN